MEIKMWTDEILVADNSKLSAIEVDLKRSRFYNIKPKGLGTYRVESLHSYLLRLAEMHQVPVWILLEKEVMKIFSKEFLKDYIKKRQTNHVHYINGCSEITEEYLNALEILTTRDDLINLTLLNGRGLLGTKRNMLKKHRSWCPLCLEYWKDNNLEIYEPLIWSINLINFCPDHHVKLEEICHTCGSKNKVISSSQRVGYCGKCDKWLGVKKTEEIQELDIWDSWCILNFNQLLEFFQNNTFSPLRNFPNEIVKMLVDQFTAGNISEFSRILRVSMISEYLTNRTNITFEKLLNLSFYFKTTIVDLINFKPINTDKINLAAIEKLAHRQHTYYDVNPDELRKELQIIIDSNQTPPLSMAEVIKFSKYSTFVLYTHAKDLCEEITLKRKLYLQQEKEIKRNKFKKDIIPIVKKLIKEGIYPTEFYVRKELQYKVFNKELKELIDEILMES
jgi:hypothetical protein